MRFWWGFLCWLLLFVMFWWLVWFWCFWYGGSGGGLFLLVSYVFLVLKCGGDVVKICYSVLFVVLGVFLRFVFFYYCLRIEKMVFDILLCFFDVLKFCCLIFYFYVYFNNRIFL